MNNSHIPQLRAQVEAENEVTDEGGRGPNTAWDSELH